MDLNDKVTQLEDEIKILKNEVQAVLLDLRESFLNNVNPFNPNAYSIPSQSGTAESQSSLDAKTPLSTEKKDIDEEDNLDPLEIDDDISELTESETNDIDDDLDDDLFEGPVVSFMPASNGNMETAPKETNMGWNPENDFSTQSISTGTVASSTNNLDLTTIESLSGWVENSVHRLGHERTRIILDVSETMGYMIPELKNILVKFIHPTTDNENLNSKQDYLSSLIELNNLLGTENRMEIALLYILCQEYENR